MYETFLLKNIVTNKKIIVGFLNFLRWEYFFILLRDLKQILPRKPCAILYLLKDRVANLTPLKNFFKNFIKIK